MTLNHLAKYGLAALMCVWLSNLALGQPDWSSKQLVEGYFLFKDYKTPNLYYYAPGNLSLAYEKTGEPMFKLVQMRYTGTACYGDLEDTHFLNLAQFTIEMEEMSKETFEKIKSALKEGFKTPVLRPLPIRHIDSYLVAPVGEDAEGHFQYKKIGEGSYEGEKSSRSAYWTRRTFTLKLENYEAQILWGQVEKGKLALSFGYAFYADVVPGFTGEMQAGGDSTLLEMVGDRFEGLAEQADTAVVTRIVKANAFPVEVDVIQFPGALARVDINESLPPAYAAMEIKCYDFTDNLRPDLLMKRVELKAVGVNGQQQTIHTDFLRTEPEIFSKKLFFPYAVRMDMPLWYRVIEYNVNGEKEEQEWFTKDFCRDLIDVTTPLDENRIARKEVEVEIDLAAFESQGIKEVHVVFAYQLNGNRQFQELTVHRDDVIPIQQVSFQYDVTTPIEYVIGWVLEDGTQQIDRRLKVATDDYIYLGYQSNNGQ